jgi:hypothetical protein
MHVCLRGTASASTGHHRSSDVKKSFRNYEFGMSKPLRPQATRRHNFLE